MRETKTILQNILYSSLGLILLCGTLESLEKRIEFYSENDLPDYLKHQNAKGDQTLISIKGWPRNASVTIIEKRDNNPSKIFAENFRPNEGEIIFALSPLGYYPGEIVTYSFSDRKSGLTEEIKLVPYRLFAKSKEDGAEIDVEILHLLSGTFMIKFKGFKQDEELRYSSKSYDEIIETSIKPQSMLYMPAVFGKRGGTSEIAIKRNSGEVLSIEVPWGAEFIKYVLISNPDGTYIRLIDTADYRKEYPEIAEYFDSQK